MNVKLETKITKDSLNSLLRYVIESGWEIYIEKSPGSAETDTITYTSNCPGYGSLTPVAHSCLCNETNRWSHYSYIRIDPHF